VSQSHSIITSYDISVYQDSKFHKVIWQANGIEASSGKVGVSPVGFVREIATGEVLNEIRTAKNTMI